ncbi:MAG: hypothetical protein KBT13_11445 [Bacteroidales bacterium]|nr:hypothetical protein [Candidatus Sodaliphilus limicaballi]
MNMNLACQRFVSNLLKRNGNSFFSEDNIRFYWFEAMLNQDPDLNNYSLEEPYVKVAGNKELDLMYEGMNEILCFEIKFHRNGSNKSEFPHTMSAGEVINDIFRLPQWAKVGINKPIRKFLLYVTDKEMHDYLSYKKTNVFSSQLYRNELKKFYDMAQNVTTSLNFNNVNAPKTFLSSATTSIGTIGITNLSLLFKGDYSLNNIHLKGSECHIRLYEIK